MNYCFKLCYRYGDGNTSATPGCHMTSCWRDSKTMANTPVKPGNQQGRISKNTSLNLKKLVWVLTGLILIYKFPNIFKNMWHSEGANSNFLQPEPPANPRQTPLEETKTVISHNITNWKVTSPYDKTPIFNLHVSYVAAPSVLTFSQCLEKRNRSRRLTENGRMLTKCEWLLSHVWRSSPAPNSLL